MSRRLLTLGLLVFAVIAPVAVQAAAARAMGSATVASVQSAAAADLVVLDHGFDAGLRQGMVCRVTRGGTTVADVLIVAIRPGCSAALILGLVPAQSIRAGDLATIKLLKT